MPSAASGIFFTMRFIAILALLAPLHQLPAADPFPWQKTYAKVLPQGDLEYTPEPFQFTPGTTVRYIDFEQGNDTHPGDTQDKPWKHHPWDPQATGNPKNFRGPATYVFKRGTTYRGSLRPEDDRGQPGDPIRLTSDPSWGQGDAVISGSTPVSNWTPGAHPRMKSEASKIWKAQVDFLPRTLWMIDAQGTITRLTLARTPNWKESDPNDVMSEWWTWENPEWWKGKGHTMQVDGKDRHLGINKEHLTGSAEDYVGGTVWTEWGIVMGSPYPARIEAFDDKQKGIAFRGPWTFEMLEKICRGNRFYLEDRPQFLDEPGEFWVERAGNSSQATIYLRLPGDTDPNRVTIEAGHIINILDASQLHHVEISGLTFRFTNVHWDYNIPRWAHPDLIAGVIRLNGSGDGIRIHHNTFEHVHMPVRLGPKELSDRLGSIAIHDNTMRDTDHGAIAVEAKFDEKSPTTYAAASHVDVLRNRMERIGWRILSGEHGHAVDLRFPATSHMAGNFLHRIAGWGLAVFGGKPDGTGDVLIPLSRHLIHHNRLEDVLLKSNDWGGIETWQGGTFYVFNNLVINPVAFKNWTFQPGNPDNIGSFGHAYYLDGSFKNYLFNNVGAGRNNQLGTKGVNTTAIQNIYSFENTFFHNTFFRFAEMVRQQQPEAGRFRYLANFFEDSSRFLFRNADPSKDEAAPDPNASHYTQGGNFAYPTIAFSANLLANIRGRFGVFEETGAVHKSLESMKEALEKVNAQAADIGTLTPAAGLRDPANNDFRPTPAAAASRGVRVFVPWALASTVGEWKFIRNNADPNTVLDEHWLMTGNYRARQGYKDTPRYHLRGNTLTASSYTTGPLNSWAPSVLRLDGKEQFLAISNTSLNPPAPAPSSGPPLLRDLAFASVTVPADVLPGMEFTATIELKEPLGDNQLRADLHWMRRNAFGGFMAAGGTLRPLDDSGKKFAVAFTPANPRGLDHYNVHVYIIPPGGDHAQALHKGNARVERSKNADAPNPAHLRTVDVGTSNFLIEVVFQTTAPTGTLLQKWNNTGYALDLQDGRLRLRLNDGSSELTATTRTPVNNGQWIHLLAEIDRNAGVTIYLDGKKSETTTTGTIPAGSLSTSADFQVGGGPGATPLAVSLAYLRVAQTTLAESRTSIEELRAWQFDGPQFRDFAGRKRDDSSPAGALTR